ncbi:hypothetical protein M2273_002669 [Mucilaginibacter lappiensis]
MINNGTGPHNEIKEATLQKTTASKTHIDSLK